MGEPQPERGPLSLQAKREALKAEPAARERWAGFEHQPGTRLRLRRSGSRRWDLVDSGDQVWATCDGRTFSGSKTIVYAAGRAFRWVEATKAPGRDVAFRAIGGVVYHDDHTRDLVDATNGQLVLRLTGHHFARKASTVLTLPDRTTITLPVSGWYRENGVLSAVADSGTTLVEYRFNHVRRRGMIGHPYDRVGAIVSPTGLSNPWIVLIAAASCDCLGSFYDTGGTF